jgi:cobalt/nickel transport system permease protein
MSHIHLPDGVLPLWLWLSGYVLETLLIGFVWKWGQVNVGPRKFALLGIFTAVMIVVMMIELPPLSYHFNLSVVSGIILGPQLSVLAALIVNIILSFIGHGGLTVIGLNSLTISVEMIVGYYAFRALKRLHLKLGTASFLSVIVGLALGTMVGYSILFVGSPWINRSLEEVVHHMHYERWEHGFIPHINLARLAVLMFGLGAVGWVLEALLSSTLLLHLVKLCPEVLGEQMTADMGDSCRLDGEIGTLPDPNDHI